MRGSELTGLVLAGGEGRRFDPSGRRWKLAGPLPDGRPVLRASCQALLGHVDELVVVCGTRESQAARVLEGLPLRCLPCSDAAAGPGATLKHGLRASAPSIGWLVALGDMPFVSPRTVQAICSSLRAGALIARPSFGGRPGHPVGFSAALRGQLLAIADEAGAAGVVRCFAEHLVVLEVEDDGCVRDIDSLADLRPTGEIDSRADLRPTGEIDARAGLLSAGDTDPLADLESAATGPERATGSVRTTGPEATSALASSRSRNPRRR